MVGGSETPPPLVAVNQAPDTAPGLFFYPLHRKPQNARLRPLTLRGYKHITHIKNAPLRASERATKKHPEKQRKTPPSRATPPGGVSLFRFSEGFRVSSAAGVLPSDPHRFTLCAPLCDFANYRIATNYIYKQNKTARLFSSRSKEARRIR